jgi:hypothetical protein
MMRASIVSSCAWLCLVSCGTSSSGEAPDASSDAPQDTSPLCPDDVPQTCPSPIPSYKNDVAAIFTAHCTLCHSPTGVAGMSMTTYADVDAQLSAIFDQVYMCEMPPIGYPPLTTQERLALLGWLVCHAPDN